jgi:hypothetical protein
MNAVVHGVPAAHGGVITPSITLKTRHNVDVWWKTLHVTTLCFGQRLLARTRSLAYIRPAFDEGSDVE